MVDDWRDVPFFDNYQVNSEGYIRKKRNNEVINVYENHTHYVKLYRKGERFSRSPKRILENAFPELF